MFGTEFLIDGNALSLVASDANCNFYTFAYDRNNWQGQKLLTCAAFHLGAKVTKFVRRRPQPAAGTEVTSRPRTSLQLITEQSKSQKTLYLTFMKAT